jgi:acyl-CoA hydrolase
MQRREFLLLALTSWLFSACSKEAKYQAIPRGASVLAFGDSVTFGTGAGDGEDWPSLLAASTGWQIINAGVPGDTAQAARSRLPALLAEHRPALVIIELGGNDFLRRRSAQAVREDLQHLLSVARQSGAQVVLIGVPELSLLAVVAGKPSDSPIYEALAEAEDVPLIRDVFSAVLARPEWCADRIHPNAEGYRQMASGIFTALQQLGLAN